MGSSLNFVTGGELQLAEHFNPGPYGEATFVVGVTYFAKKILSTILVTLTGERLSTTLITIYGCVR